MPSSAKKCGNVGLSIAHKSGSLKMNTALEYCTIVVQEGGRRCKKSTLDPSKDTFNEPTNTIGGFIKDEHCS